MTLYSKIINFFETSKSKHLLGFVSFIESIFFPIPPDLILIPMVLSKKFDWMSSQYIMNKESKELLNLVKDIQPNWGGADITDGYLELVLDNLKSRSKSILDIVSQSDYFFHDPNIYDKDAVKKCWGQDSPNILITYSREVLDSIVWDHKTIDESMTKFVENKGIGKGQLIQPLRVALTGTLTGPSMVELMVLLKKDTCIRRIKNSLSSIKI